jgi:3-methyladenine DNA glycosylase AlkD
MSDSQPPTTVEQTLELLASYGHPRVREMNARHGAPDNQFGVKMGDIRTIAKSIKVNHELGLQLWGTGNVEAMFLATLIVKPKLLSEAEVERMAASVKFVDLRFGLSQMADWLMSYVIKQHPAKETLRRRWMESDHPMLARAGWSLTAERIAKDPEGLDPAALLDRIERDMPGAPAATQWTMNGCLAETGIRFPEHRQRALEIGERLGVFRDYPVSKGCTSPFAPIWIEAMVARSA